MGRAIRPEAKNTLNRAGTREISAHMFHGCVPKFLRAADGPQHAYFAGSKSSSMVTSASIAPFSVGSRSGSHSGECGAGPGMPVR